MNKYIIHLRKNMGILFLSRKKIGNKQIVQKLVVEGHHQEIVWKKHDANEIWDLADISWCDPMAITSVDSSFMSFC